MKLSIVFLALAAFLGEAQTGPIAIQTVGVTNTQAVLSYTAPDANPCTVQVSETNNLGTGYAPVPDVDPNLFAGADQDSRTGNVSAGRLRLIVIGAPKTDHASSGLIASRALRTTATHFVRVTCGATSGTATFTTANIPFGRTWSPPTEVDLTNPGHYQFPEGATSSQWSLGSYVDPMSGNTIWYVNTNGWVGVGTTNTGFTAVEDASGNWTNPSNALGTSGYAQYAGNSGDWLWLRLGAGAYPDDSTLSLNQLSYQNISLQGYCSGPDCGSGGQTIQVCITPLGIDENGPHCEAPVKEIDLPATPTAITVCGDTGICTHPAAPGDVISYSLATVAQEPSTGRIYNTSANYSQVLFQDVNDCKRLRTPDWLATYVSGNTWTLSVTALNCSATPPQATIAGSWPLDGNGTTGYPFRYYSGVKSNPRYGILIRKKSTTANSTISVNSVTWHAASAVIGNLNIGAGGFSRICSKTADANGYFHCSGQMGIYGYKDNNGTPDVRFLGFPAYNDSRGIHTITAPSNDWLWDDFDANVFYAIGSGDSDNAFQLLKFTYTGNDAPKAALCYPYSCVDSRLPMSVTSLTPPGSLISDQLVSFSSNMDMVYDPAVFAANLESVQGHTIVGSARRGGQDSLAWLYVIDLGNGLPIGAGYQGRFGNTRHVIAAMPMFARQDCRWCTLHTYQNQRTEGFATPEFQIEKGGTPVQQPYLMTSTNSLPGCSKTQGTCAPCPSVTIDGVNYTGQNWCGTVNVTSSWNSTWGAAPAAYTTGDPLSTDPGLHYLQHVAAGDLIVDFNTREEMKVVQVISATQLVVERGYGYDQTVYYPRPMSVNDTFSAQCDEDNWQGAHWFYEQDPTGTNGGIIHTTFINHAFGRDGVRVHPKYAVSLAPFNITAMADPSYNTTIGLPEHFAGAYATASGNAIENHPSYNQDNAPPWDQTWFVDGHPVISADNDDPRVGRGARSTNVSGNLWKYGGTDEIDLKHFPMVAYSGQLPLHEVSGPGSVITGNSSDAWKFCMPAVNGECVAGSHPGEVYLNIPGADTTIPFCYQAEFYSGWRDMCATSFNAIANSYAQWRLPPNPSVSYANGIDTRVLARPHNLYRDASTMNTKPTPDGKYTLAGNVLMKIPPLPPSDSVNRATFVPVIVSLKPPAGTNNAIVEFGYDQNFYCTNRAEKCVANQSTINEANPFVWPAEAGGDSGITGVTCANGCQIAVPAISGKVVYYRFRYRDASNQVIGTGPVQIAAIP